MNRLDPAEIRKMAKEAGWTEIQADEYTLSFITYHNDCSAARMNVWPRSGNVGVQCGKKALYKRGCSPGFIRRLFNNEEIGDTRGIKIIHQK